MGNRSRQKRAQVKDMCRQLNYRENEFGELRHKMTKAEARRRFLEQERRKRAAIREVVEVCCRQAQEDMHAAEDREFLCHVAEVLAAREP